MICASRAAHVAARQALIAVRTLLARVRIGVTVAEPELATYAVLSSGVIAMNMGVTPHPDWLHDPVGSGPDRDHRCPEEVADIDRPAVRVMATPKAPPILIDFAATTCCRSS